MKVLVLVCLFALTAMVLARPKDTYTDKYDNINLDEILENRRLLLPYIKCVLDQGKCSSGGQEVKDHIKDAMRTDCSKCTEKQKKATKRITKHMYKKENDYWNQIIAKYDPERNFAPRYEEEAKKD